MTIRIRYITAFLLLAMAPLLWWSSNALRISRTNTFQYRKFATDKFYPRPNQPKSTTLHAKKPANERNPEPKAGWSTINFGTPEAAKNQEMEDRLKEAERWVSKKLTDKEANELNKKMGIEQEVLAAMAEEEDNLKNGKMGKKNGILKGKKPIEKNSVRSKLQEFITVESSDAAKVKGFLELNPYICSGCGTPFQSKTEESPGFLPKDKIKDHLKKAQRIRDKQDAIKILEMAGIEVDSPAAEEILRDANVSADVIAGVRALARGQESLDEREKGVRSKMHLSDYERQRAEAEGDDDDEDYDDEDNDYDDDKMDGLEFNLEELSLNDIDNDLENNEKNVFKIKNEIASMENYLDTKMTLDIEGDKRDVLKIEEKKMELNVLLNNARGLKKDTPMYINDIDQELKNEKYNVKSKIDEFYLNDVEEDEKLLKQNENENDYDISDIDNEDDENMAKQEKSKLLKKLKLPKDFYGATDGTGDKKARPAGVYEAMENMSLADFEETERKNELLKIENENLKLLSVDNDSDNICICQRCFRLQMYGQVEEVLRPGWSEHELLTPERFENLLGSIKDTEAVVLCIVDIFDLKGSLLRNLKQIAGAGMNNLMESLMSQAADNGGKVFVMGAANVGKSSFINRLLTSDYKKGGAGGADKKKNKKENVPQATVSNLPGTTLNFLKIKMPNGVTMIDTPGLINKGQLTSRLTTEELRMVIPTKPINAVTLRLVEGKCVLMGGLAIIEHTEGKPFFFTFFISNEVKLHPTDAVNAENFLSKHVGTLVSPPHTQERYQELGPFKDNYFEIEGDEWKKASTDVVIAGLGWISITGPGILRIKVTVPEGTSVGLRTPLLPFEAQHSTVKFSGGRLQKKSRKNGEKAYGWRA